MAKTISRTEQAPSLPLGIKGDVNYCKRNLGESGLFPANVAYGSSGDPSGDHPFQLDEEGLLACGIKPTTIRLSIGTEHIDDIIDDLETWL